MVTGPRSHSSSSGHSTRACAASTASASTGSSLPGVMMQRTAGSSRSAASSHHRCSCAAISPRNIRSSAAWSPDSRPVRRRPSARVEAALVDVGRQPVPFRLRARSRPRRRPGRAACRPGRAPGPWPCRRSRRPASSRRPRRPWPRPGTCGSTHRSRGCRWRSRCAARAFSSPWTYPTSVCAPPIHSGGSSRMAMARSSELRCLRTGPGDQVDHRARRRARSPVSGSTPS